MVKKKEKDIVQSSAESLSQIFGTKAISESEAERWFLPSGNLALDYIMSGRVDGTGGYPSGIVEVHGDPATGKSLLFALAIAEAQKQGLKTILGDAEGRWDYDFSTLHGVNADLLRDNTFYPETVEEFAVKASQILEHFGKVVMILDSLAILSTIQEKEDLMDDGAMKADQGRKAQKIKAAMRVLSSEVRKTGSLFLISNHVIAQPGSYITHRIAPGGGGVPFQANVRLELTKPTPLKLAGKLRPVGVQIHVECTKNSVVPPYGTCDLDLFFASGVDKHTGLLTIAKDIGIVEQKGGYNYYGEKSFRSTDFGSICSDTDVLQNEKWKRPYWLEK